MIHPRFLNKKEDCVKLACDLSSYLVQGCEIIFE
ncbi:MAG: hypothetical protein RIR48_2252 [Bacteroidota bacterium]